jgi:F0F1-type ATP synthase epsilon subunit
MAASIIQPRSDTFVTPPSSQRAKSLESNELIIVTRSDDDQDDGSKVSGGTVKLSDTSVKLSSSSPVKSSDKSALLENRDQARQAIKQLIADFQVTPSQAQGAHSNVTENSVRSLLG